MIKGPVLLAIAALSFLVAFCTRALILGKMTANGVDASHTPARRNPSETRQRLLSSFAAIGETVGVNSSDASRIREKLARAGLHITPGTWRGIQTSAAAAGALLGALMLLQSVDAAHALFGLGVAALGIGGPNLTLASLTRDRQREVASSMASTLELLSITVRSGYPLERGLKLIAETADGPLAAEFKQVDADMNLLGMSLERALRRMNERCPIPEVSSFTSALIQASQQGTSVSRVLDSQARLARNAHYAALQERVNKLPAKLVVPIFGIMMLIIVIALVPPVYNTIAIFTGQGGLGDVVASNNPSVFG